MSAYLEKVIKERLEEKFYNVVDVRLTYSYPDDILFIKVWDELTGKYLEHESLVDFNTQLIDELIDDFCQRDYLGLLLPSKETT